MRYTVVLGIVQHRISREMLERCFGRGE